MKRVLIYLNVLVALPAMAAVNVPVAVKEALYPGSMSGVARAGEPLTVGIPLPDSAGISNTNVLGLTGATAAQFTVTGRWPSGNIKWVKVRAIVPSVSRGGTSTVTLTSSGGGDFGGADLASDNGSSISVDTGTATFTIKKANFNVVDQVVIGGKTVVSSGASQGLVVIGPDPSAAYPANVTCLPTGGGSPCTTVYSSSNDAASTAVIEENGPAMAVIKATGNHVDGNGRVYMHYTARLYFYKEKSYVKVTAILRNADYGTSNTFATASKGFQGYELRISPNITGTLNYAIANHTSTPTTGTLTASDSIYLYQAESNALKPGAQNWCAGYTGCVLPSPLTGYAIVKNGASVITGTAAQPSQGWADLRDSSGVGLEVGQYQLAAYGNKSLEFLNGGSDVRIGLWARQNNTSGVTATTPNKAYYLRWPQWDIQEAFLNFHAATLSSPADEFLAYQHYLLGRAPVSHYNAAQVFEYPLLDVAEENNYYAQVTSSASPGVASTSMQDLGSSTYPWFLRIWKFYPWSLGGGGNQMEFRLSHLFNFIRRGFTGGYLDAASYYKMVAQQGFALSDGFDWRSRTGNTDSTGNPTQASANAALGTRNWADIEHTHAYGMMDYYAMSGDETIRDAIIEGPKDRFMNTSTVVNTGRIWNARAVGNYLMWDARLYRFLSSIGDPDAPALLAQGQATYNLQIKDDLCASGNPAGCTFSLTGTDTTPYGRGTSRTRGVPYQWGQTITQEGGCTSTGRAAAPFQTSVLLQGLWEFREAQGPGWADYMQAFDLAYGMAQWALTEAYSDDGTASWNKNGFRYYISLDVPNSCDTFNYRVLSNQTVWFPFYIKARYEGTTSWNRMMQHVLQRNIYTTSTDEFYHFTAAAPIYAYLHPSGQTLQTVPITNVAGSGGGTYTISWQAPAGAVSYRIKWSPKQIVDWIGFDPGSNTFIGDPATTANWFAATDAANIPAPSGSTQTLTINTGVTGLTAANFMVKAYVGGGGTPPPAPDTALPTVSMTAPAAGATLTGAVTVSATANDNVGVAAVQFKLDGVNLGSPVSGQGPSYTMSWNTTAASNGTHVLSAVAVDAAGNSTTSGTVSVSVNNTAAPPVISSVSASGMTSSSVTITWITDVPSDSQVTYGTTSNYGATSFPNAAMVTNHTVSLSGLVAGTTYYFRAISRDSQGIVSTSSEFTFATTSAPPPTNGGQAISLNTWTSVQADGFPAQILGYDKSVYVNSRNIHCIWGAYHQTISSEPNDATVCYSYAENRWSVLQKNGVWHSDHNPSAGHTTGIWAYMPDRDAIVGMTDGSGSNVPEKFLGHWWLFDVGGLSGQNKAFSPKPWMSATTPDAALTYDTLNSKLVLFPDGNGVVQVCDPAANSCSAPNTKGTAPPALGNLSLTYNSNDHKVYLYGGGQGSIYTFDVATSTWTKLSTTCTGTGCVGSAPPSRRAAGFAYSVADNVFLMAGGVPALGGSTAFTDTWIFDPSTLAWKEQTPPLKYANHPSNATFDRLTYDSDSNVFILMSSGGANNYKGGVYNSYSARVWAYAYSSALNYGRISNSYTPPAGSLNRVSPTSTSQSWAFDPAIAASGSTVYAGWIETGAPFDGSNCGLAHPYVQSATSMTSWTGLPGGAGCTAIDSEPVTSPGNSSASKLQLAVVNGRVWEAHEKWNLSGITSSAWAKSWSGTAWTGGQVGCFSGPCSAAITQRPEALISSGAAPAIAVVEENHSVYIPEAYLYVAQWNGSAWSALGGKLNVNGAGSRVLFAALASDAAQPAACWSEEVSSSRSAVSQTPQIRCAQWNGTSWARMGSGSLNRSSSSWASGPTMTYAGGKYYTGWVERTTSGPNRLYVCRWDGSTCTLLGGGALNFSPTNGWAAHPSLATDGTNVYVAWEEQSALGQKSTGYVKKWDGSSWSQVGGALNADAADGSVEGISLAVVQGLPTAVWTELTFGNLRQIYGKQWNGAAWTGASGTSAPPPPVTSSCDLNGDGKIDTVDVQSAIDQALGTAVCTTGDLQGNGQCSVVGVQRVIAASLGGSCRIGN